MKSKDSKVFLEALTELEIEKGIDREEMLKSIENALYVAYKKQYKDSDNAKVEINRKTGEVKIFSIKTVVEGNEILTNTEISLDLAIKQKRNVKLGDELLLEVDAENFKRAAIQNAKQIVIQKVREFEKLSIYRTFKNIEHEIVTALVKKTDENGNLYVEINGIEAIVPKKELTPLDIYEQGDNITVYIGDVLEGTKNNKITISRRVNELVEKLFEREIPEITEGLLEIKSIAREPGVRSKVAIYSQDENLDVKGACIGKNGSRIANIVNELQGEKIDIIMWDEDIRIFVKNALNPAEIRSIEIVKIGEETIAKVEVDADQLSLAIGKKGQNSRLANKLCNLKVVIEAINNKSLEDIQEDNDEQE